MKQTYSLTAFIKNKTFLQKLALVAALGAAVYATGCASTDVARNASGNPQVASEDPSYASTKTAMSFGPNTDTQSIAKWPLEWNVKVNEVYTFAVLEPGAAVTDNSTLPAFDESLAPGALFVEAAGADRPAGVYRIIQHSPNPR